MTDWLILLLAASAIIAPVVLLFGFAGCSFAPAAQYTAPVIESAIGESVSIITLTWMGGNNPYPLFELVRTNPDSSTVTFPNVTSPFNDTMLEAGTSYQYVVNGLNSDGSFGAASSLVTGITTAFEPTFGPPNAPPPSTDENAWQGYTLVQRIEASQLTASGSTPALGGEVRISLQPSAIYSASIDSIYISQPDPAGKPYDSLAPNPAGTGLTKISDSLVISVGSGPNPPPYVLPPVLYSLDRTQPLLIAFQFSSPPTPSGIRYAVVPAPPPPLATAYYFLGAEAALTDRSPGYTSISRLYLIAKIEVG
jgi:hypothetical protein